MTNRITRDEFYARVHGSPQLYFRLLETEEREPDDPQVLLAENLYWGILRDDGKCGEKYADGRWTLVELYKEDDTMDGLVELPLVAFPAIREEFETRNSGIRKTRATTF